MEVLVYLVEQGGRIVAKKELQEAVWGDASVSDDAIWRCVSLLRKALGDSRTRSRYIETLPRRGYRVMAREASGIPLADNPAPGRSHRMAWLIAAAAGVAAITATVLLLPLERLGLEPQARPGLGRLEEPATSLDSAERHYQVGLSYYTERRHGSNQMAIQMLERATDLRQHFAAAHAALADAYAMNWLQYASHPDDRRWLAAAQDSAERAVALRPDLAEAHKAMGLAAAADGRLEAAAAAFQRAFDLDPGYSAAAYNLGALHLTMGRPARSIDWFERAASLTTESTALARHLTGLGTAHMLLGDLREAHSKVLEALHQVPLDPEATALLARIELQAGQLSAARATLDRALAADPRSVGLREQAAAVEHAAGALSGAAAHLAVALDVPKGGHQDTYLRWACLQHVETDGRRHEILNRARASAEAAIASRYEGWFPWLRLAAVHAIRGERRQALDRLDDAWRRGFVDHAHLRLDPIYASLWKEPGFLRFVARLESSLR